MAVLTGLRLLAVDSATWRVQLNLPLRKLHAVHHGEHHQLLLTLRRRGDASAAPPTPLECHSEEAALLLHDHLDKCVKSLRERRRIWHTGRGARPRAHSDDDEDAAAPILGREA